MMFLRPSHEPIIRKKGKHTNLLLVKPGPTTKATMSDEMWCTKLLQIRTLTQIKVGWGEN